MSRQKINLIYIGESITLEKKDNLIQSTMITLTPHEYLVQISLKTLYCQPSAQVAKVSCELHYGQSYVKYRTHPQISPNGQVNFKKQTLCIPYCDDIAVVFKKNTSSRNEVFLGHYQIDIVEYFQRKIYYIQINQKLYETDTMINLQVKLLDKQRFQESETEDLSEQESNLQKSQYSVFEHQEPVNMRKSSARQIQSEYQFNPNTPKSSPKKSRNSNFGFSSSILLDSQQASLLPQQFNKKLSLVNQILTKKNMIESLSNRLHGFNRNNRGQLKSPKIEKLEMLLKNKKQEYVFNTLVLYTIIALVSFFFGILLTD